MDSGMMANGGMMEGTQEEYTGAKPMTVQGGGGGMMSSSTDEGDKGEGDKGEGDEVPPPPPPPKGGDDEGSDSGKGGCDGGWWDGCEDHPLADWEERRERRGKWFAHPLGR
ncbi:hypothetical protein FOA52_013028 [Chlamydomonas sp. UWO 241]|nr:hypothetical protein FOA52_013028 [Chlamydomonas sp. UWO 241]